MTEPLPDVWTSRDYPVLCEVARRFEAGATTVGIHDVMTALNLDERTATAAAIALRARGYVETQAMDRWVVFDFTRLNGAAYFATGLHPEVRGRLRPLATCVIDGGATVVVWQA